MKQVNKAKIKKKRNQKIYDEYSEIAKSRATFMNFRKKIEGGLVEDDSAIIDELERADETFNSAQKKQKMHKMMTLMQPLSSKRT